MALRSYHTAVSRRLTLTHDISSPRPRPLLRRRTRPHLQPASMRPPANDQNSSRRHVRYRNDMASSSPRAQQPAAPSRSGPVTNQQHACNMYEQLEKSTKVKPCALLASAHWRNADIAMTAAAKTSTACIPAWRHVRRSLSTKVPSSASTMP